MSRRERVNSYTGAEDKVGELAAPAQAKLLRILQGQEFERVGGTKSIKVDVQVIAATNRDLAVLVKDGAFRADLFYRLNIFPEVAMLMTSEKVGWSQNSHSTGNISIGYPVKLLP